MDKDEIKQFLRDNLALVVEFESPYESSNHQRVGLRFAGDSDCFTWETVMVPESTT